MPFPYFKLIYMLTLCCLFKLQPILMVIYVRGDKILQERSKQPCTNVLRFWNSKLINYIRKSEVKEIVVAETYSFPVVL